MQKSKSSLVLFQHGESEGNKGNYFTGMRDVNLTSDGIKQAQQAGEMIKGMHFSVAFTSNLKRANDALRIILTATNLIFLT